MANQVCVAAVIEKDNRILLLREEKDKTYEKSKGLWTLPVGKMNKNESLVDAVLREVKEETGYDIRVSGIIGIYELFSIDKKKHVLGVAFKGKWTKKQRSESPEFKNLIWTDVKRIFIKDMKLRKGIKEIIKDYQKGIILPVGHVKVIDF